MKKSLLALLSASVAFGATVDQNTTIQATADTGCVISNSPSLSISWSGFADATGNFTLQVLCASGTPYTVSIDNGQNADSTSRRAKDTSNNYVRYRLYWDSGYTQEIGLTTGNTRSETGSGSTQNINVYAKVLAGENQTAPQGTYTDTLTITITW